MYLTPKLSVRAEWSFSDTLSLDRSPSIYPYVVEDLVSRIGLPLTSLLVPQEITERRDVKAGFALVGYHLGGGRASIELLGGLGLVNERVTVVTDIRLPVGPRRAPATAPGTRPRAITPWPWSAQTPRCR